MEGKTLPWTVVAAAAGRGLTGAGGSCAAAEHRWRRYVSQEEANSDQIGAGGLRISGGKTRAGIMGPWGFDPTTSPHAGSSITSGVVFY